MQSLKYSMKFYSPTQRGDYYMYPSHKKIDPRPHTCKSPVRLTSLCETEYMINLKVKEKRGRRVQLDLP